MKIPEGRQILSTHIDPKLHERAKIAAIKRKVAFPMVMDEAIKLWLEAERDSK
jgi:hypothetical protein